jgi:D-alanyl-D-alanine carboxypeptidase/D-alanyl-D-alanine-endopeptidase (penicillin-binding protein 4)
MRRTAAVLAVLALLLAVTPASGAVRANTPLQTRLAKALRVPHVPAAGSAAFAVDLRTGEQLFALNDTLPLEPASTEKLALTFALLRSFMPTMRIETRVDAAGALDGATLDGSLVLVGGGDPTLTNGDLRLLARRVYAAGIRHVTGGVVGDESLFDSKRMCPGWKPSFYIRESPPLSALVVDRARYRTYTAPRPAKAAALLFRDALRSAGVSVDRGVAVRKAPLDAIPVTRTLSPPLSRIVSFMDQNSDNFTAEMLLKLLAVTYADQGTTTGGARIVLHTLRDAEIPMTGVRIVDGSGLSQSDRLTVAALVGILQAFATEPDLQSVLLHALPVAGVRGTLKDRMRTAPLRGHVVAKTGTTSVASSLAGYVNTHIAFAVIQNGHPLAYWWAREAQDRFARVLASS